VRYLYHAEASGKTQLASGDHVCGGFLSRKGEAFARRGREAFAPEISEKKRHREKK